MATRTVFSEGTGIIAAENTAVEFAGPIHLLMLTGNNRRIDNELRIDWADSQATGNESLGQRVPRW